MKSKMDLPDKLFSRYKDARSYASVRVELWEKIKKAYHLERGVVCGVRWKRRKRTNEYGPWRIQVYWKEKGRMRYRVVGGLDDVWRKISGGQV